MSLFPKVSLPKQQRRRDIDTSLSMKEMEDFLKANSVWPVKAAMLAYFDENSLCAPRLKGIQNFLSFQQNRRNVFWFSFNEAASLMFSRRLVVFSLSENQLFQLSAHQFLNELFIRNASLNDIEKYCIFTRIGASSRKVISIPKEESPIHILKPTPPQNSRAYSEILKSKMNLIPQYQDKDISTIKPPTLRAKIPQNTGFPENVCLSIGPFNSDSIISEIDAPLLYPLSYTTVIRLSKPPTINSSINNLSSKNRKKTSMKNSKRVQLQTNLKETN